MNIKLVHENAVLPQKAGINEIGYDITCISLDKQIYENVYMFDTGIQIQPPKGYYTEIVPRSSIVKTGYSLANNTGIIDPTYRGNVKVVLVKHAQDAQKIELPFKKCQLILRKIPPNVEVQEVQELDQTERGDGGFGSTD
tara:strand:- start:27 stop:446 length:420 start_codon:yes stop_codon:yes gene_type:complete